MKKSSLIIFCLLAALLCAGCHTGINSIENADKTGIANSIDARRFVMDEVLAKHLTLRQITAVRNANNLLEVQLEVANPIHKPAKIKYQFTWFNAQGMLIDTIVSDWQKTTFLPGETQFIRHVAPQPDCADFKINLMYDK